MEKGKSILGLFMVGFLLFALIDCVGGKNRYCRGIVQEHLYNPPYTTIDCDGKGRNCHTVYHSAEYHLLVLCQDPEHVADLETSKANYILTRNGDEVEVGERIGFLSHSIRMKWLHARTPKTTY
jgi:hypothetical protein